jgi:hypothetical protein
MKINLKQEITVDHFETIIVGALEGGSNYWYELNVDEFKTQLLGENNEPLSSRIAKTLYDNSKFQMNVYDIENEGELLGTVTQESMLRAIEITHEEYPDTYYELIEGQDDANTADVLFQIAAMGEITFG